MLALVELFRATSAVVAFDPSEEPFAWTDVELCTAVPEDTFDAAPAVLLTVAVVFPSIWRPAVIVLDPASLADALAVPAAWEVVLIALLAAAAPEPCTALAVLTEAADEARNALLTEGVFNVAAEVKWVVLTAPSLIWAKVELLNAPTIRQIAMTLLALHFIHPVLVVKKNLIRLSYIHPSGVLLPPTVKKNLLPDLTGRRLKPSY